jgi:hypothetical protein
VLAGDVQQLSRQLVELVFAEHLGFVGVRIERVMFEVRFEGGAAVCAVGGLHGRCRGDPVETCRASRSALRFAAKCGVVAAKLASLSGVIPRRTAA